MKVNFWNGNRWVQVTAAAGEMIRFWLSSSFAWKDEEKEEEDEDEEREREGEEGDDDDDDNCDDEE